MLKIKYFNQTFRLFAIIRVKMITVRTYIYREFKHDVYGDGKRQRLPLILYSFLASLNKPHKNR